MKKILLFLVCIFALASITEASARKNRRWYEGNEVWSPWDVYGEAYALAGEDEHEVDGNITLFREKGAHQAGVTLMGFYYVLKDEPVDFIDEETGEEFFFEEDIEEEQFSAQAFWSYMPGSINYGLAAGISQTDEASGAGANVEASLGWGDEDFDAGLFVFYEDGAGAGVGAYVAWYYDLFYRLETELNVDVFYTEEYEEEVNGYAALNYRLIEEPFELSFGAGVSFDDEEAKPGLVIRAYFE